MLCPFIVVRNVHTYRSQIGLLFEEFFKNIYILAFIYSSISIVPDRMSIAFSSHRSEIDVVVDNFKSDKINGLEYVEIPSLRIIYGSNKLEEEVKVTNVLYTNTYLTLLFSFVCLYINMFQLDRITSY